MMIDIDWKPSERKLRQFGCLASVALFILGLFLYGKGRMTLGDGALAAWAAAVICCVTAFVAPKAIRPLFLAMSLAAFPIGFVVSHLILAVLFYGILTPVGFLFRLMGRDPLHRRFDPDAPSYWVPHRRREDKGHYFRQF